MEAPPHSLPRFSCEDLEVLRRRRAAGTLYANPAGFRDGSHCYVVTARGAPGLDEEFRVELAPLAPPAPPAPDAALDSGWLPGAGDKWPAALRAFATGRAGLEMRGGAAVLVLGDERADLQSAGSGGALRRRWARLAA